MNDQRLEELTEMADDIDRRVKILSHSKTNIYKNIADRIMELYSSEIMEEVDEVFAIGTEVSHSPESATDKTVNINIEPGSNTEDVEKRIDLEQEVRGEIYENFPDLKNLRKIVHISLDW